jgi:hypothetical protein
MICLVNDGVSQKGKLVKNDENILNDKRYIRSRR